MRFSLLCALGAVAALAAGHASAADDVRCLDDAMLVFDASGSMAGTDMNAVRPHIASVREALADVLPAITPR
ncbi:MAG TPA: hypothetical protein VEA77_05180, partial [Hyphomicrobium sp.]|nr:hypothetical protein [Hyphomicrobium sp.]